jgi:hypothetical protein
MLGGTGNFHAEVPTFKAFAGHLHHPSSAVPGPFPAPRWFGQFINRDYYNSTLIAGYLRVYVIPAYGPNARSAGLHRGYTTEADRPRELGHPLPSPRLVPRTGSRWKRPARYEALLRGHKDHVRGALELRDGRILSWSHSTLRIWRADGTPDCEPPQRRPVRHAILTPEPQGVIAPRQKSGVRQNAGAVDSMFVSMQGLGSRRAVRMPKPEGAIGTPR